VPLDEDEISLPAGQTGLGEWTGGDARPAVKKQNYRIAVIRSGDGDPLLDAANPDVAGFGDGSTILRRDLDRDLGLGSWTASHEKGGDSARRSRQDHGEVCVPHMFSIARQFLRYISLVRTSSPEDEGTYLHSKSSPPTGRQKSLHSPVARQ